MADYTVLLLVPDTRANTFGHDTFVSHTSVDAAVEAAVSPEVAARIAVAQARDEAMDNFAGLWDDGHEPADLFHVLAVYPGHLDDLNPEA